MIVDAGEGVLEIDGDSAGDARDQAEHSPFASGTGQVASGEGRDRGRPVDDGHPSAVDEPAVEGYELTCEVVPVQPGPVGNEKLIARSCRGSGCGRESATAAPAACRASAQAR